MKESARILLADDEPTFLESTADLLRSRRGYECHTAKDAMTALDMLRVTKYDVIISDIVMPGNETLQFIKDVKEIEKGMPVILVTGYPSVSSAIRSVKLPVVAYLVKPFEIEDLIDEVEAALNSAKTYNILKNSNKRIETWREELYKVEEMMTSSRGDASSVATDTYFSITLSNIADCLIDLKSLSGVRTENTDSKEACHMFNCPRISKLSETLSLTMDVLEKTRTSFKSKELYQLRKQIEKVVVSVDRDNRESS